MHHLEASAFEFISRYYESDKWWDELDEYFKANPQSGNKQLRGFHDSILLNDQPHVSEQNSNLIKSSGGGHLRTRIRHCLGFRQQEAEDIIKNLHLNGTKTVLVNGIFHGSSTNNSLRLLDSEEAIYVSAFAETPMSVLQSGSLIRMGPMEEAPWYCSLFGEVRNIVELVPEAISTAFKDRRGQSSRRIVRLLQPLSRGMSIGRLNVDDLKCHIGVRIVYCSGFCEIALTILHPTNAMQSRWDERLLQYGNDLCLRVPCVYSKATQFLSSSFTEIHRMTWLFSSAPEIKLKLYSRLFSPRTVEATIYSFSNAETFKYPTRYRANVVQALKRASILGSSVSASIR